eukprot:TRINITY_DN72260_c0_g1_i1.p1 TRINITY_DN72260_c0_g1~~TRINITY_DN72260_c0_g1_i1.p1  ORF type:complete len:129 (+),score=33.00 TRINITY_DN72260_c0_g1_i1:318-704(+)
MSKFSELDEQVNKNYQTVANAIRNYGAPNDQFPKDIDIEYGYLRDETECFSLSGLGTILKNMKRKQMVDYRDPFIKDSTIITLIEDYYQEFESQMVTYEQITDKIQDEDGNTGHMKSVAAEANASTHG